MFNQAVNKLSQFVRGVGHPLSRAEPGIHGRWLTSPEYLRSERGEVQVRASPWPSAQLPRGETLLVSTRCWALIVEC
jgi:hypothetical protein